MWRSTRSMWCLLAILLSSGCGTSGALSSEPTGSSPTPTAAPSVAASPTAAPTALPTPMPTRRCPNPEGGIQNACLGNIPAGTYRTAKFQPSLTYTVPDGWANLEDLGGNFLLLPPGATLGGVNPGTSDYLGVYSSVVAPEPCTGGPSTTVPATVDGLVAYLSGHPALVVTNAHEATVGGLSGTVLDILMKPGNGDGCSDGVYVDVYVGLRPSSLVHGVIPDYPLRVYLLEHGAATLAIEVADPSGGSDVDDWFGAAGRMIDMFEFAAN